MAKYHHTLIFVFFMCSLITGHVTKTVSMWINNSPPIIEGDRIDFTCLVTGTPRSVHYTLSFFDGDIVSWMVQNDDCMFFFQPPNRTLFDASCDTLSSTFSMSILSASYSYNQHNVTCEAFYSGDTLDGAEGVITIELIDKHRGAWLTTQTTQLQTTNPGPIITTTTDHPDVSTTEVIQVSNDVDKQILIVAVVSILIVEICQCVIFAILYKKDRRKFVLYAVG